MTNQQGGWVSETSCTLVDIAWCATRATLPVVLVAAPVVYVGLPAVHAGAAYVGRTLLGRSITGGAAACAAEAAECETTEQELVDIGLRGLELSQHAIQRMVQRGVSYEQIQEVITNGESFSYFHDGVWKVGYYDSGSQIFVGTVGKVITTIINNVKPQYIESLKKALP